MPEGIKVGELFAALTLDKKSFDTGLSEADKKSQDAARTITRAGVVMGAALGGAGIAALKMGDVYDDTADRIRTTTGKTGADLKGLEQSWSNVAGRVKEDTGLVGDVLADLARRTGLTGDDLETLTQKVIEYSRVTGTDARANTEQLMLLMSNWQLPISESATLMDRLYRASQTTGVEIGTLQGKVTDFGPQLRAMGLDVDDSIALLAGLEKNGVNADGAIQGLTRAVAGWTVKGKDAQVELRGVLDRIQELGPGSEATGLAVQTFGRRAGVQLADAIATGKFNVSELLDVIKNGSDTVQDATADTRDFGDGIAELKNKIKMAIGPIMQDFAGLATELGNAIYLLPALGGAIGGVTAKLWLKVAALAAASGGWKAMLLSMGPFLLGAAAVAGGLIAIDQGLNIAAEKMRAFSAGVREMTSTQRESLRTQEVFGMSIGSITDNFANFLGVVAPWHQVAADAAEASDALNHTLADTDLALQQAGLSAHTASERLDNANVAMGASTTTLSGTVNTDIGDVGATFDEFGERIDTLRTGVVATVRETAAEFHARMVQIHADAAWAGAATPGAFADAARSNFSTVQTAFSDLKDLMKNTLSPAAQEAELIGIATSKRLANALNDNRPEVRGQAQQIALDTIEQLHKIDPASTEIGTLSTKLLADALPNEKPALQDAIDAILGTFQSQQNLNYITTGAEHIVGAWRKGVVNELGSNATKTQIGAAIRSAMGALHGDSPPKEGPLREIDKWGRNVVRAWLDPAIDELSEGAKEINRRVGVMFSHSPAMVGGVGDFGMPNATTQGQQPQINQQIYGLSVEDVERGTRRALRREALGWGNL